MEAATRHPLQSFADLITIEEYKKTARPKVVMTWAPHPKSLPQAVPNSFAEWMNATDYEFVITHPEGYELDPRFVGNAKVEYDQKKAFEGADFIYAKNWSAYKDPNYGQVISTEDVYKRQSISGLKSMNVKDMLRQASDAAKQLITLSDQTIIGILKETAQVLRTHTEEVLAANRQDLERMDPANPKYDRLKLTEERLQGIAADMENVSTLPSPLNKVLSETIRPNGMVIRKVTVPFGVIGVIYEARPNVTFDVFSLCFRSGKDVYKRQVSTVTDRARVNEGVNFDDFEAGIKEAAESCPVEVIKYE